MRHIEELHTEVRKLRRRPSPSALAEVVSTMEFLQERTELVHEAAVSFQEQLMTLVDPTESPAEPVQLNPLAEPSFGSDQDPPATPAALVMERSLRRQRSACVVQSAWRRWQRRLASEFANRAVAIIAGKTHPDGETQALVDALVVDALANTGLKGHLRAFTLLAKTAASAVEAAHVAAATQTDRADVAEAQVAAPTATSQH